MSGATRIDNWNTGAGKCRGVNSLVSEKAQASAGLFKSIQEVNAAGLYGDMVGNFNVVALDHSGQAGAGGVAADA